MKKKDPEDFRKILKEIAHKKSDLLSVYRDFCRMAACCLALQTREEEYLEVAKNYTKEELSRIAEAFASLVNEMQAHPFTDVLGVYYMEVGARSVQEARGEFFTPKSVCTVIAEMTVKPEEVKRRGRPITICDPAAGSGGIPLAIAELLAPGHVDLMRLTCQDISSLSCDMCYINMTLWGVPAKIIWGDTLRMTVNKVWCNVHWARVGEPFREKVEAVTRLISQEPKSSESDSEEMEEDIVIPPPEKRCQLSLGFDDL